MSNKPIHLDFLIVGAQKAGTTSLHDWLVQHDDVCLPGIKETHYFSHAERFQYGEDWYLKQFGAKKTGVALVGEVDPEYMYIADAVDRIKKLTDVNKFIFVLRRPLDRAYSQYLMTVRRGFESLPFDEAILAEKGRLASENAAFALEHQSYISRGLYSVQIQRFLDAFPDGEFLFINFDDLVSKERGGEVYEKVCRFVGTKHSSVDVDRSKSSNQAASPRFLWLRNFLYKKGEKSFVRKLASSLLSDDLKIKLFVLLDSMNQKALKKSDIKPLASYQIDSTILAEIRQDVEKTQMLTGLDLMAWIGK